MDPTLNGRQHMELVKVNLKHTIQTCFNKTSLLYVAIIEGKCKIALKIKSITSRCHKAFML